MGGGIGFLWAFSEPERAPHGGLLLGLPGGVLFLEGVASAVAVAWISHRWSGYGLAAPLLVALLPIIYLVYPSGLWFAGIIGLAPFAALARFLALW